MQAYARVMMDLEIKLAKEAYGEPRKTPRHTGEKMQTVDHRPVGCRENEPERPRGAVGGRTGLPWAGLAGVW